MLAYQPAEDDIRTVTGSIYAHNKNNMSILDTQGHSQGMKGDASICIT